MPPKRNKPPPKSAAIVEGWRDQDLSDLTEGQIAYLAANPDVDAVAVIATIRKNRAAALASEPPAAHESSDDEWGAEASQMATGPDFPSQTVDLTIESSILGKRPQPLSPAPSTTLQTSSPARVGGLFSDFKSKPAKRSLFDEATTAPTPSPAVDWEAYFKSFETALAALKLDHAETPRFMGTMLTGLQSLLRDERVLSLQVDGGFTVANLLDSLPRSTPAAALRPAWASDAVRPVPKPHVKQTKVGPSNPLPKPKEAALAGPPALPKCPPPSEAPAVPRAGPAKRPSRRQGKHTVHGPSRRGIIITPPGKMILRASSLNPVLLNKINILLAKDLKVLDLMITASFDTGPSVFLDTTRVPSTAETAFVLKHVRNHFELPEGSKPITTTPSKSTSYLKVVDIPITDPKSKLWLQPTRDLIEASLRASPVGSSILDVLSCVPRIMRVLPHSDTCIAWIDIEDSVSGTSAKKFIGKFITISGVNCRVSGARPHSGSIMCTRCQRWGHHHSKCRREGVRCPLCGGPHRESSHNTLVDATKVEVRHCVNCSASKMKKRDHSALDRKCPFWEHRYDREWLKKQFPVKDLNPPTC
jgi:hypothetical protein